MPVYKLCYFEARGVAEMCRYLFAEAEVSYEDDRCPSDDWLDHKPKYMFGQLPVLFVDGEEIAHSRAAVRYLAREFKMDGGNSLNAAKTDMWIEIFTEAIEKLVFTEKDKDKKREKLAKLIDEVMIPKLKKYEDAMQGTYLFGEDMTVVDIVAYSLVDPLRRKQGDKFLDAVSKFKALMTAVETRPKIAKWIAERPVTELFSEECPLCDLLA